jgi:hypothetical protein
MRVVLQMVMAFVVMILLAQLWLFTVTLDAMESHGASLTVAIAALVFSFLGCAAVWVLIRQSEIAADDFPRNR